MPAQIISVPPRKHNTRRLLRWQRQLRAFVLLGALFSTLLMVFYPRVPDFMGLALLLDNIAPWLGLGVPVLLLLALFTRSRAAVVVALIPGFVWLVGFGAASVPLGWTAPPASAHSLNVSSQNIKAGTGSAVDSARELAGSGSDVIALQELDETSTRSVTDALNSDYPHHFVVGTVGVWSKYPLMRSQSLDLGLGWKRALTTQVVTGTSNIRLYVVHAASARLNDHENRDTMLASLAATLRADSSTEIIAVGDFNATSTDRSFAALTDVLDEPNQDEGMLGFTWPREPFSFMRLDHVLQRGLEVTSNTVVPAGESDHLAVRVTVNVPASLP